MHLIVNSAGTATEVALRSRNRERFQSVVQQARLTFPAGGTFDESFAWAASLGRQVADLEFASLAANDYREAPKLLDTLDRRGLLGADCYRLVGRTLLQAGPDATSTLRPARWIDLARRPGFTVHDRVTERTPGASLLYMISEPRPRQTLAVMTPFAPLAAAYAAQPGRDGQVWRISVEPRRLLAAVSPKGNADCGWACTSLHVLVDSTRAPLPLPVADDAEYEVSSCPCEGTELAVFGAGSVVEVPIPR